jgi:transposase
MTRCNAELPDKSPRQIVSARLIAIANALEGMDRASAARLTGMDRQILRDWVQRYNTKRIVGLPIGQRRDAGRSQPRGKWRC